GGGEGRFEGAKLGVAHGKALDAKAPRRYGSCRGGEGVGKAFLILPAADFGVDAKRLPGLEFQDRQHDGGAPLDRHDEDRGALHQVELRPGNVKEGAAGDDGDGIHASPAGDAAQAVKTKCWGHGGKTSWCWKLGRLVGEREIEGR